MKAMQSVLAALDELFRGKIPPKIPEAELTAEDREIVSRVNRLIDFMEEIHGFVLPLAQGQLKERAPLTKNFLASPFKELHSRLTHLTWQAEQVAKGDYSQRVDFMGDFSRAFNAMVEALDLKDKALAKTIADLRTSEQELAKRALELEQANKELESFSYSVSHDLREPLRAIDGFSRMLVKELQDTLPERARHKLDVIRNKTMKMNQLIDEVLAFSRLGRQALTMNLLDMERLAAEVWDELQSSHTTGPTAVKILPLPAGCGDKGLIRQVFVNLLANARKYTRNASPALIEVGGYEAAQESVYYVKDNGVGFDMRYYERLFKIFQRLHSEEDYEGTGVGLCIAKRIIERHGGRIWAEGKVNEGATFYFTLPKGSL